MKYKILDKAKKALEKGKGIKTIEVEGEAKRYHIIHIYEFKPRAPEIVIKTFFGEQVKFVKKLIKQTGNRAFAVREGRSIIFEEWAELDEKGLRIRMEEPRFFAGVSSNIVDESTLSGSKKIIAKALKPQAKGVRKGLSKLYDFHYKLYEVQGNGEETLIEEA